MKSQLLLLLSLVVLSFQPSLAQTRDFRESDWGATIDMVKQKEKAKLVKEEDRKLVYSGTIAGFNATVIYTFSFGGQLMKGKYLINTEYMNPSFYLSDYELFKEFYTKKYGAPVSSNIIELNTTDIPESERAANLASGHVAFETTWKLDKTDLIVTLSKLQDRILLQVDYISPIQIKQDNKERMEKMLKDL